jgi:hypothetical protein
MVVGCYLRDQATWNAHFITTQDMGNYLQMFMDFSNVGLGRAIARAVGRWLPNVAARLRARVSSSVFCGGQSDAGAGFIRVFQLPLPVFIPPNSPFSQSHGAGTTDQKWPMCRVDPVWTPPSPCKLKKINVVLYRKIYQILVVFIVVDIIRIVD